MLRPYVADDLTELLDTWSRASKLAHSFLGEAFFVRERQQIADDWLPIADTTVFEVEGQVVGFLSLIGNEVGALFVDPDHQKLGIGQALMNHAAALHPVVELGVFEENSVGRRFYDRYGFENIEKRINPETGHPELRMRFARSSGLG